MRIEFIYGYWQQLFCGLMAFALTNRQREEKLARAQVSRNGIQSVCGTPGESLTRFKKKREKHIIYSFSGETSSRILDV